MQHEKHVIHHVDYEMFCISRKVSPTNQENANTFSIIKNNFLYDDIIIVIYIKSVSHELIEHLRLVQFSSIDWIYFKTTDYSVLPESRQHAA